MSDIYESRGKGLEEEYFHRKNQEAINKLRAKINEAVKAQPADPAAMHCPRCEGTLKPIKLEDVETDVCDKCGGVWLDQGELGRLMMKDDNWLSRLWKNWNAE